MQAYYEWMPVREPTIRIEPERTPRLGDLAEIVLFEERHSARSNNFRADSVPGIGRASGDRPLPRPKRTLLGTEQEAWVGQVLAASTARWKLIGQGVMLAQLKAVGKSNADGGSIFVNFRTSGRVKPPARDRLHDQIASTQRVVLTGATAPGPNDPARDPQQSGRRERRATTSRAGGARIGVEFVTTFDHLARHDAPDGTLAALVRSPQNPTAHVDPQHHGYPLLDVTPERVVGEYWTVDTVAGAERHAIVLDGLRVRDGAPKHGAIGVDHAVRPAPPPPAP